MAMIPAMARMAAMELVSVADVLEAAELAVLWATVAGTEDVWVEAERAVAVPMEKVEARAAMKPAQAPPE